MKHNIQGYSDHDVQDLSLRVGIGGPAGTGKTALLDRLCKMLRDDYNTAAITNDIYTRGCRVPHPLRRVSAERIMGVETGGCPHTAIREDASMNLAAVNELNTKFPGLDIIFIESGGDNLAATFFPGLQTSQFTSSMCLQVIKYHAKEVRDHPIRLVSDQQN